MSMKSVSEHTFEWANTTNEATEGRQARPITRFVDILQAYAGGPQGYRLRRIILTNFWLYGQQEFEIPHGRLFLAGENASGKSTVLTAALPLGLDGDLRPNRLDTFGGRERRIEYYVLGGADSATPFSHERRTAYIALEFEWCDPDHPPIAPEIRQRWENGDVLSLDSGGNFHGYIGDLARMAVLGEPDGELKDLLQEIDTIQRAAFAAVRAGALGGEIYTAAETALKSSKQRNHTEFLAHGMGLVSHEAPRLTATGPVPYDDPDAHLPLEAGMVVSIETTMKHPRRGLIKLEDTVAVTANGYEIFGEGGRGWNIGGTALPS